VFSQPRGSGPPPAVTPIGWKWDRLDTDTYFYSAGQVDRPLVLAVPASPGDGSSGFNEYLERYLVDEGYSVGYLNWRGDFSRTAKPSAVVSRAFTDLARLRGKDHRRFDSTRIVLFGAGESAFLAMLLSADTNRLRAAGVPPESICATVLLHPLNLDATNPDSYLARRQFSSEPGALADLSALAFARTAPPILIMTQDFDLEDQKRGEIAAGVLKSAGRTVERTTYAQLDPQIERTYFGWITNPATLKLGEFLRTYCPAKKR
jgi:hypothetical protein